MKTLKLILLSLIVLFLNCNVFAQSKTEKEIKKAGKILETVFRKKKEPKKDKDVTINTPTSTSKNKEAEQTKNSNNTKQLKAGSIHPDAMVLNVDLMESFNGGAARVVKGNASALIDSKGGFLIPFNKYQFMPMYDPRSQNGIFVTTDNVIEPTEAKNHLGFVNSDGKVVTLQAPFVGLGHDIGGYFLLRPTSTDSKSYFYDKTGKMFSITNFDPSDFYRYEYWGYRQLNTLFLSGTVNSKYGFRDKNDKIIVPPKWDEAENFSDGAALVGQKNEFDEIKYGFIDTSGKIIVPLKFSRKPESFSDGLAKVFSNEEICDNCGQVYYGYIDKSGKMVINSKDFEQPGMTFSPFYHGYAFAQRKVLTKEGVIVSITDFLKDFGIPEEIIGRGEIEFDTKNAGAGKILVSFKGNPTDRRKKYFALLDIINKKTLFYWYADVKIDYFDPVSGLAHVVEYGDKVRMDLKHEGYINEEGVFMILKGEASKW